MKNDLNKEEIIEEEMASIGKYLAFVIVVFAILYAIFGFQKPELLEDFITWTKSIVFILVGGGVAYIVIKIAFNK